MTVPDESHLRHSPNPRVSRRKLLAGGAVLAALGATPIAYFALASKENDSVGYVLGSDDPRFTTSSLAELRERSLSVVPFRQVRGARHGAESVRARVLGLDRAPGTTGIESATLDVLFPAEGTGGGVYTFNAWSYSRKQGSSSPVRFTLPSTGDRAPQFVLSVARGDGSVETVTSRPWLNGRGDHLKPGVYTFAFGQGAWDSRGSLDASRPVSLLVDLRA